jgi:hypothetical protein
MRPCRQIDSDFFGGLRPPSFRQSFPTLDRMDNITAGELGLRREQLEEGGAMLLGRLMFAFGRLESNLGLFIRSVAGGKYLDGSTFHARLESLSEAVRAGPHGEGFSRKPYEAWIVRAHRMRQMRKDMVHGRWIPEPHTMCVMNVVWTSDLSNQRTNSYTLSQLEDLVIEVGQLERDLGKLLMRSDL